MSTFRLPNEILDEVLQFCVVAEQKDDSKSDMPVVAEKGDIRWRLAAVCARWRRIVCDGMPKFWASIGIDNASLMDSEKAHVDPLLCMSLVRSGSHPLSVEHNLFAGSWFRGVMPAVDRKCMKVYGAYLEGE
ncbi:hypothetical protein D9758_010451 [Tetrapyrgos nigripes]|uniref:F-box domain-containing protein n=1 Tax=Tetrapyrgos nigripes TaxID=182062 RepID=A0A8H5FQK6_9AGAR|nr:hypothetical protein D9758_010451 [Tetrapyrgos nigripes]